MKLTLTLIGAAVFGAWARAWWAVNRIELEKARQSGWPWRRIFAAYVREYVHGDPLPWWPLDR